VVNQASVGLRNEKQLELETVAKRVANGQLKPEIRVVVGPPFPTIIEAAENEGCDLIAMSTHGRGGLGRGVMGSVADQVMPNSNVPTLLVAPYRAEELRTEGAPLTKIVVPLDGTPEGERVLPYVEELALALGLEVVLARVIDTGGPYTGLLDDARFVETDPAIKEAAREYLEATAEGLRANGVVVAWKLGEGVPAQKLVELARETAENMVAIATRGHSGIERWLEGSVSEAVVRVSGDPVLVIPPLAANGH
jgi:nucleotide-binding universal stress UspA family protein